MIRDLPNLERFEVPVSFECECECELTCTPDVRSSYAGLSKCFAIFTWLLVMKPGPLRHCSLASTFLIGGNDPLLGTVENRCISVLVSSDPCCDLCRLSIASQWSLEIEIDPDFLHRPEHASVIDHDIECGHLPKLAFPRANHVASAIAQKSHAVRCVSYFPPSLQQQPLN